jgi:hypothetical protein
MFDFHGRARRDMSTGETATADGRAGSHRSWVKIGLVALVVVAGVLVVGRTAGEHVAAFVQWVDGRGPLAPIVFIVGYAVATVAFVPGSVLTLAAGAVFGIVQGGIDPDLRAKSASQTATLGFPGFGIGGLSVGVPIT